eukprot:CAMPEP_0198714070 /NCGR_PEP_ID=MMETSP1471-20131121/13586_1 /TAXON_ID=41880 /ORGANISM="Pycnococcus provasolii, Strain RCC733" /LENGTH=44 /DNA_ID= /DNA_START= /DNA_END= /DNA_ORIENTATION=
MMKILTRACRLAFVTTLLVTKVARGQPDFEECGSTCGDPPNGIF